MMTGDTHRLLSSPPPGEAAVAGVRGSAAAGVRSSAPGLAPAPWAGAAGLAAPKRTAHTATRAKPCRAAWFVWQPEHGMGCSSVNRI